jgi:nucleoside phosphorylase
VENFMNHLPTAVICTPLDLEHRAVLALLSANRITEQTAGGTVYELTELRGRHATWRLVIALTSRLNEFASAAVERAILTWNPQILLLVGVAGGRRDAAIGDVIAATKVYGYESGRDTDSGFHSRVDALRCSSLLDQRAHRVSADSGWTDRLSLEPGQSAPQVFHRPIASGNKVITGTASATADLISRTCDDAQGVDMEGYGAMAAASNSSSVEAMVVRGISDLIDDKSKATDRTRQPLAARNAAAFALALIESCDPGPSAPKGLAARSDRPIYIGAIGDGAVSNVAASGPRARGHQQITINNR